MKLSNFAIVILAAGKASRFGSPKQLARLEETGLSVLQKCLHTCSQTRSQFNAPIYLVTGSYSSEITEHLGDDFPHVEVVQNDEWQNGLSSSIRAGVVATKDFDIDGVLFIAADQIAIETSDLSGLIATWQDSPTHIACAQYTNRRGIPALLPRSYFAQLTRLSGDKGAKFILNNASNVAEVPMPNAALDIDTPEDLVRYQTGLPCSKA